MPPRGRDSGALEIPDRGQSWRKGVVLDRVQKLLAGAEVVARA
jgi:site-specific DNA recombinase